ncbi:MAG TPA: DUF2889 domain-containing protein [Acidimicrobiia bacterium]|nr:DUF2889 domain-containing protein [Acidimicrobiia bacterium]
MTDQLPPAPANPQPGPPARRPGSIRRTSTVLMHWPGGRGTQLRLDGRARDLVTPRHGDAYVVAEDSMTVGVSNLRVIEDIAVTPARAGVDRLVGAKAGGGLRRAIDDALPDERERGSPLYLLLDDMAGSSLIAGFAWSQGADALRPPAPPTPEQVEAMAAMAAQYEPRSMIGICSGFRPGSSALTPDGFVNRDRRHNVAVVPPLADANDGLSWHELDAPPEVAMRRARRIDVREGDGALVVDAMFRDSCWRPDGVEVAVHEYHIDATVDVETGVVTSVVAEPRVLPYPECPGAAPNAAWLVGASARGLRREVLERIQGISCCTHLNDALRSLAEVPVLAGELLPAA